MEEKITNIRKYDYILMVDPLMNWNHPLEIGQVIGMTRNNIGEVDTYTIRFKNETVTVDNEVAKYCKVLQFKED